MRNYSETPDTRGMTLPTLTVYSLWAVAYAVINGIEIVGTERGNYGRVGWILDNTDGRAKRVLDVWREGTPIVNGRALIAAHSRLMDRIRNDI